MKHPDPSSSAARSPAPADAPSILYCHCSYAQVVPEDTKNAVLEKLCASGRSFEAVSDLCQMSAARDPRLKDLASGGPLRIAACYERSVRWLFHAAEAPLPEKQFVVLNMRTGPADQIAADLLQDAGVSPSGGVA